MKKLEILWELPKCDTETESEQRLLENSANRLVRHKVVETLQFFKQTQCLQNTVKQSKTKGGMPVLMEASGWERWTEEETGSCSDWRGHAQ